MLGIDRGGRTGPKYVMFRVPFAEPESQLLIFPWECGVPNAWNMETRAFQISVILNTTRTGLKTIANNQRCGVRKESVLWRNQLIRDLRKSLDDKKIFNFTSKKPEENELTAATSTGKERGCRAPIIRGEREDGVADTGSPREPRGAPALCARRRACISRCDRRSPSSTIGGGGEPPNPCSRKSAS